jgi:hypothetical protein
MRVIIESPYKGDIRLNKAYARLAMLDSIMRGEVPFASHLLYTQVLDDSDAAERALGIALGMEWWKVAQLVAFYIDLGMSEGMRQSHDLIGKMPNEMKILIGKMPYEMRRINGDDLTKLLNIRSK